MKGRIIDNYAAVTVGTYLEICKVSRDESLEDLDKQVRILALLYGQTVDEILDLPLADYKVRAAASAFLEGPCEKVPRVASKYTLGDLVLVPSADPSKLTAGQYIDFQTFAQKGEETLVEQLSCFLIPEGKTYGNGYDVREVQSAIRDYLPVADVLALAAFFLTSWSRLIEDTRIFSERERRRLERRMKGERTKVVTHSTANGDGSPTLTR